MKVTLSVLHALPLSLRRRFSLHKLLNHVITHTTCIISEVVKLAVVILAVGANSCVNHCCYILLFHFLDILSYFSSANIQQKSIQSKIIKYFLSIFFKIIDISSYFCVSLHQKLRIRWIIT